jgi:SAM-dependent methyltransferase
MGTHDDHPGLLGSRAMNRHGLGPLRRCACLVPLAFACTKAPATSSSPAPGSPDAAHHEHAHGDAHDGHHGAHGPHHDAAPAAHAGHGPHADAAGPNAAHRGHAHNHRFEDAEAWAKQFDDPSRDAWQRPEAVLDALGLSPDARVADLGAGTGYFAIRLARRVPHGKVLANDVEPDMVRYLGERAAKEGLTNVVPVQGRPDDPALPEAVDVAFMCNVYHHIEDRPAYFRKLAAQLRPGGRLVVVDFKKDAPDDAPGPPAAMRVARQTLVAELEREGFVLSRVDEALLPHQYVVELRLAAPAPTHDTKAKTKAKR